MLDDDALDRLFRTARTHRSWLDKPVPRALLETIHALASLPPTSANCSPMRVVFVVSPEAKRRLMPCLSAGNVRQTMTAPVTAIIAFDERFTTYCPGSTPRLTRARGSPTIPWRPPRPRGATAACRAPI